MSTKLKALDKPKNPVAKYAGKFNKACKFKSKVKKFKGFSE